MSHIIVRFEKGQKGPIGKRTEDNGAFIFPDRNAVHAFPAKVGVEVLVKITKTNFQKTARFCRVLGGPEMVARLRQKRLDRAVRIANRRLEEVKAILKKNGVSTKVSEVVVDQFVYIVRASLDNYEKRRIHGKAIAHGQVTVEGFGLDPNPELCKKIAIESVNFEGRLLHELPNREDRADEARLTSPRPRGHEANIEIRFNA